LAALAAVAVEALALAGRAITDALAGALGVLVESAVDVRRVNPRELRVSIDTDMGRERQRGREGVKKTSQFAMGRKKRG
jgi:hypothetical protein